MAAADAQQLIARLEAQVLDQYSLTARNLDDASPPLPLLIATVVQRLSAVQPALLAELRPLERKLGLILTLFKASVWSLLRQREEQQLYEEELRQ